MKIVTALKLFAAAALLVLGASASAQSSSYTPGTVWTLSNIKIEEEVRGVHGDGCAQAGQRERRAQGAAQA